MSEQQSVCLCDICVDPGPEYYVAPRAIVEAVRNRQGRTETAREYCPRCGGRLGRAEVVVDSVAFAHVVQPCEGCWALWVVA